MIQNIYDRNIVLITDNYTELTAEQATNFRISHSTENMGGGISKHTLLYKNFGKETKIIPVFQKVTQNTPNFYMIPCVNYNGNSWGTCKEPKGFEADGKPWVFSSDRMGIPGCSVAEFDSCTVGIFSHNKGDSVNSSASLFVKDGVTVQRIYFSHVEYPYVYALKYVYNHPILEFIGFSEGEEKEFVCYTFEKQKQGEKFGYGGILDFVSSEDYIIPLLPKFDGKTAAEYGFEFIQSLVEKTENGYLSNMGFLPDGKPVIGNENAVFKYRPSNPYQIGWCGQNITVAEMHIRKYIETKNQKYLEIGTGIIDTWINCRSYESGIISANFKRLYGEDEEIDSCNEGWLLWKLCVCCELLDSVGVDTQKYRLAANNIAGYYLKFFKEGVFPQISNPKGETVNPDGCAGTMLVLGFIKAYCYFKEEAYLIRAKDSFDSYYNTYLSESIAAGGALDTYCIDKESAGPMLRSAILLYDITNDESYIEKAKQIAYYLMTWTFYHDVPFPENSDCNALNVRTTGGTSVSTAHHHLDVWGVYYVPDMIRLWKLTENKAFLEQAKILWAFALQYLSDGTLKLHGMTRPKGAQNEAVLHCNWNWSADGKKGQLNDWLVSWVTTFRMDVYYALESEPFDLI